MKHAEGKVEGKRAATVCKRVVGWAWQAREAMRKY